MFACPLKVIANDVVNPNFGVRSVFPGDLGIEIIETGS